MHEIKCWTGGRSGSGFIQPCNKHSFFVKSETAVSKLMIVKDIYEVEKVIERELRVHGAHESLALKARRYSTAIRGRGRFIVRADR